MVASRARTIDLTRLRVVRARRARPLREFSGGVAAAAARDAPRTSPPCTRLRAPPTTSPTKATGPPDERHRLLDGWLRRLRQAAGVRRSRARRRGRASRPNTVGDLPRARRDHSIARSLPVALLRGSAERVPAGRHRDALRARGPTLLDYCRRSANPVGRLVLRIAGHRDARLDAWSDAICTALQLTNFWQDSEIDFARGRIYLPRGARCTARARTIWRGRSRPRGSALARRRADAALFDAGRPLCDAVRGRLRYELRATWLGGMRILDRLERRRLRRRSAAGRRSAPRDAPWLAGAAADAGAPAMSRDTSFYYSFLVLPPRKRRAIVAVWDFCRAVDDAVDESAPPERGRPPAASRSGGGELAAVLRRRRQRAAHAAGTGAAAVHPRVQPAARAVRGADRRRRDGSRRTPAIRRSTRWPSTAAASRRRSASSASRSSATGTRARDRTP